MKLFVKKVSILLIFLCIFVNASGFADELVNKIHDYSQLQGEVRDIQSLVDHLDLLNVFRLHSENSSFDSTSIYLDQVKQINQIFGNHIERFGRDSHLGIELEPIHHKMDLFLEKVEVSRVESPDLFREVNSDLDRITDTLKSELTLIYRHLNTALVENDRSLKNYISSIKLSSSVRPSSPPHWGHLFPGDDNLTGEW